MVSRSLTASEFLEALRKSQVDQNDRFCGASATVDETQITEPVNFAHLTDFDFGKRLTIEHVRFCHRVSLGKCHFGDTVKWSTCHFEGGLDFAKSSFENGAFFNRCVAGRKDCFKTLAISMDDVKIRGELMFDDVTVIGCISARRLRLAGDLRFTACAIEGESTVERAALDLSDSKIKGSVIFEFVPGSAAELAASGEALVPSQRNQKRTSVCDWRKNGASVLLRGAEVSDMVKLAWARFAGEVDLAFIKCRSLESEAGIFARRQDQKDGLETKAVKKREEFGGASIDGALTLSGGEFGLIHLYGITVTGEMFLIAGKSGQIIVEDAIYKTGRERLIAPSSLGHFIMSRWRCRDFLRLHPATVIGESNSSRIHGVVIKSSIIDRSVSLWPGVNLQNTLEAYLERDCVEKDVPEFFAKDAKDAKVAKDDDGQLVEIKSGSPNRNLLNRWCRRMVVSGNVSIDHCSIGDDLLLTGIDLIAKSTGDDGRIEIVDSKIEGNLVFRSPVSFLADAQVDAPLLRLLAQRFVVSAKTQKEPIQGTSLQEYDKWQKDFTFVPACCHMLDTSGLKAVKIDLTGLCVRRPFPDSQRRSRADMHLAGKRNENLPNAIMSNLELHGKIATFARISNEDARKNFADVNNHMKPPTGGGSPNLPQKILALCFGDEAASIEAPAGRVEVSADIFGSLDLQHSTVEELLVSDDSFCHHFPSKKAADTGIVLDHTRISKLYVARSELSGNRAREHNGFPVPVSLLNFSAKTWFLEDESSSERSAYIDHETTDAAPYLDLLENDPEFRMSSYLTIEKSLRDRGLTEEAKEIFVAGYYRDVRTESRKNGGAIEGKRTFTGMLGLLGGISRHWKSWRRGDGRYRSAFSTARASSVLQSPGRRGALARVLMASVAVACAAGVLLEETSAVSFGYLVLSFLSFLTLVCAAFAKHDWLERLETILALFWFFGGLYAFSIAVMHPSAVSIGYLATLVFSWMATHGNGAKTVRLDDIGAVAYLMCFPAALIAAITLLIAPTALAVVYLLFVLSVFFTLRGNLFRLRRPWREYLQFCLCLAWCIGVACFVVYAARMHSVESLKVWFVVVAASFLIIGAILLSVLWCFLDQLYWSLLDYGTSALRLAGVIFVFFAISFAFVSGNRDNFEPTLFARIPSKQYWTKQEGPHPKDWTFGERVWMTLRYHVPLVGAIISEEWQPADDKLRFADLTDDKGRLVLPTWWSSLDPPWPRARDWYGAMLWLNWILWPLFLPFLIHKLLRERS